MENLQLSLKTKWFNTTDINNKDEEYRAISPFWCARLLLYNGQKRPIKFWQYMQYHFSNHFLSAIQDYINDGTITFKNYGLNIMTLGYPKSSDTMRIKIFEHLGISIGYGNTEWGAMKWDKYFVIKHGKRIQ